MDKNLIIESLSPMERSVLPVLAGSFSGIDEISEKADLDKTTTLRAVGFLKNKGLVETEESEKKIVILGILGLNYLKKELPERALLNALEEKKIIPIGEIRNVCGLNENEAKIALGTLKKKALIEIRQGKLHLSARPEEVTNKMIEELFMEKLPMDFDAIVDLDKLAFSELMKRKDIVEVEEQKLVSVKLTKLGKEIAGADLGADLIEALTPKILKSGAWKGKKFRRYDLTSSVPRVYGGKRHFTNQAMDYAKSIWLEMGFAQMSGNYVESGFFVFDALFTAQDHPVREMQDTFYIKGLDVKSVGNRNQGIGNRDVLAAVKKAHEGGVDGSKGWQYKWDEEDARKVLLRTHTTSLSIRKLMEIGASLENRNQKIENRSYKFFAIGKCFRNETVDWSHGFEFNQTEGIVVDENANFRQLLGYLKEFYKKMGYEKIRVRPGYFAYTEPSLEIDVWHPERKKWVELGGAGMFRPEVTIPMFGRHVPVLAWGQGFDRIITEFFGIKDLREVYKNDLTQLRNMKFWVK
ncbi:MAG: phenylalanine--tRNA ligase subunit alpha [Nanoarchaeota archaeon]|nr:phenylalanine--tRNA ligase subunit alpha [Nanoarchaeota archaeon]